MKNLVISLLVASVAILGAIALSQIAALRREREQTRQLNMKLAAMPKTPSLDLQEKCATQARKEFNELGWNKNAMAGFSNHYNTRLNKCFMQIQNTDTRSVKGAILTSRAVSDAFEGVVYGSYIWSTEKGKKYWEVPPLECKVTLLSGEEKSCHSSEEFDSLVKQYMTE